VRFLHAAAYEWYGKIGMAVMYLKGVDHILFENIISELAWKLN
jgi:hypothetical protein